MRGVVQLDRILNVALRAAVLHGKVSSLSESPEAKPDSTPASRMFVDCRVSRIQTTNNRDLTPERHVPTDSETLSKLDGIGWNLQHSYAELSDELTKPAAPARFKKPQLVLLNRPLAAELGLDLDSLSPKEQADLFSGQQLPSQARPVAQAYAGHQFGGFTMLGDGRAILVGEQLSPAEERFDVQFKGAGETPYSRRGDGRAALGPMLREYIISEAMHALGIPTTRSLAVVATGEPVYRERALHGAVLTRVAGSHIRVGTFQYLATRDEPELLKQFADYTIDRHYPTIGQEPDRYLTVLRETMKRQAALIAQWQSVGFIHGVMNTDNASIPGETIDYGPCAFMNSYDPRTVFSSIDHQGRYAYGNQPPIAQWNMARFAETLLPLLDPDEEAAVARAMEALNEYPAIFEAEWLSRMRHKLGLTSEEQADRQLVDDLLEWMESFDRDFTNTFDMLSLVIGSNVKEPPQIDMDGLAPEGRAAFDAWAARWMKRLDAENASREATASLMLSTNPFVIPRNHRVEEALSAAIEDGDLSVTQTLLKVLAEPFKRDESLRSFQAPPPADQCDYKTFCGT